MKRAWLVCFLVAISLFCSGFSFREWQSSLYEKIKQETINGLEQNFNTKLTIGKANGLILGQISFDDVVIPSYASAKKVSVNYNLFKLAYYKDVVPAITQIIVDNATINIKRQKNNQLSVASLLRPNVPGAAPPPLFQGKIIFTNCRVNYQDELGFRSQAGPFQASLANLKGELNFQAKDKLYFSLAATPDQGKISFSGYNNLATPDYKIKILAQDLNVSSWGNYAVSFAPLVFSAGSTSFKAELGPPVKKNWPVSFSGNFNLKQVSASLFDYHCQNTSGKVILKDDQLKFQGFSPQIGSIKSVLDGTLAGFGQQSIDLKVKIKAAQLKELLHLFPQTDKLAVSGSGDAALQITGKLPNPKISGSFDLNNSSFLQQTFSAHGNLTYKHPQLLIELKGLSLYQGIATGQCALDFSQAVPDLKAKVKLSQLNLTSVAQNVPGVVGFINGELNLSGSVDHLKGQLQTNLSKAQLLGQPLQAVSLLFAIKNGDVDIEKFSATSQIASLGANGKISTDLSFAMSAEATGIKLSGQGLLGPMQALVELFKGTVKGKFDDQFFASPLKNLSAQGSVSLKQGRIGEQLFDRAAGELTMGSGQISVQHVVFEQGQTVINVSGHTGLGTLTDLDITSQNFKLEDLKILNYLLPEELKDPLGSATIRINLSGQLPETTLTSLDSLFDLNASGEVSLKNAQLAGTFFPTANLNFYWHNHQLSLPNCSLTTANSQLAFGFAVNDQKELTGSAKGIIDLNDCRKLTEKYGRFKGILGLSALLSGKISSLEVSSLFWAEDCQYNSLKFDRIKGRLDYSQNHLRLPEPLELYRDKDEYQVTGAINFDPLQPEATTLAISLNIIKAGLLSSFDFYQELQGEIARKISPQARNGKVTLDLGSITLPKLLSPGKRADRQLYSEQVKRHSLLKRWQQLSQPAANAPVSAGKSEKVGGELSGKLQLSGPVANLSGNLTAEVKNGYYQNFTFDKISTRCFLHNQTLQITKLELQKRRGKLTAQGQIDFNGQLNLALTGESFSWEIMQAFFDNDLKGSFNLKALVQGQLSDPDFSASLVSQKTTLADLEFDQLDLWLNKKGPTITLNNLTLSENDQHSKISGSLSTAANGPIDLTLALKDKAVGLLNLFTSEIKWETGKAALNAKIGGSRENLAINGSLECEQATIYIKALQSHVHDLKGSARLENSQLKIKQLTGIWQGSHTKAFPNFIGLAGNIDLTRSFAAKGFVTVSLVMTPTQYYVDLENLYTGVVKINEASLSGPFYFNLSQAPTLKANVEINNALITISPKSSDNQPLPLGLDLDLKLAKNTYAIMGDVATLDLSNIFMNLELASDLIKISGTLAQPQLMGPIVLKRGTVTIFNREFSLLQPEQQGKFFSFESGKINQNTARFEGNENSAGTAPNINITAKVEVENIEENSLTQELSRKKVIIVSHLNGMLGTSDKESGLAVSFDSFVEDKSSGTSIFKPADYSEQEIKVMLLPDFIKSLTGINKGEKSQIDTNVVLTDYLSSRFQTLVFRGVERELEQKLGLESLTLEYNFGKRMRQELGIKDSSSLVQQPDLRVGFVKGFFDKLYIDLRYSQTLASEGSSFDETSLDTQITYKLSSIWSIIYYLEQPTYQEITQQYKKVTLQMGFSFW
ncbi:hypothetical protein COT42_07750 [Candidatus Saganbacteria bacterium CG08_land_8_20_14_0_20_45_16]|uniref:Translocation and assembly module TamB C-terminal domain-containing protein n=1 Tax=Candidatus Saganbacteria bacterium CG08_land_8_20_14_0_20_45_16 TaxID=2014293 RepID=A0A2H0XUC3_UNCSA|nr:MAG: hypothetical protein COT42_07750 [Candidatus Saganbacteria bacterium CG08_land_8_20_14_0_20_45_16]